MSVIDYLNVSQTAIAVGLVAIAVSTYVVLVVKKSSETPVAFDDLLHSSGSWSTGGESKSEVSNNTTSVDDTNSSELKNVFDVPQPLPKVGNGGEEKNGEKEKPFKSSYYYAHNQLKKTGGYTDGLKAHDYQMNGPRLLSKGGNRVADSGNIKGKCDEERKTNDETSNSSAKPQAPKASLNSIPLNRYLWDDDGNEQGVAKVHITHLPGKSPTLPSTNWGDAGVSKGDVASKLIGLHKNGLIVQIRAASVRYHLYIPRMYGEVEDVKLIVKAKKLIVKLTKKEKGSNVWPQLPSKAKNSNIDPIDYINDDLLIL